jgi:hypothetical protein
METHHLSEAVAEAKGEAFRLREFALQRQDEAIARARHISGRLVSPDYIGSEQVRK